MGVWSAQRRGQQPSGRAVPAEGVDLFGSEDRGPESLDERVGGLGAVGAGNESEAGVCWWQPSGCLRMIEQAGAGLKREESCVQKRRQVLDEECLVEKSRRAPECARLIVAGDSTTRHNLPEDDAAAVSIDPSRMSKCKK